MKHAWGEPRTICGDPKVGEKPEMGRETGTFGLCGDRAL